MCSVALKMHLMGSDLVSIAYETPLTRLKLCIASLANAEGGHINNEDAPELVVSQMELAELVGVHRVSVGRLLQRQIEAPVRFLFRQRPALLARPGRPGRFRKKHLNSSSLPHMEITSSTRMRTPRQESTLPAQG